MLNANMVFPVRRRTRYLAVLVTHRFLRFLCPHPPAYTHELTIGHPTSCSFAFIRAIRDVLN